jgi:hypothetical protein
MIQHVDNEPERRKGYWRQHILRTKRIVFQIQSIPRYYSNGQRNTVGSKLRMVSPLDERYQKL